jgi:hypothetical protein
MSRDHENMLRHYLLVFDRHASRWDGPEIRKRQFRARHLVKFVRRFYDAGNHARAREVFREAFGESVLAMRLLPREYLRSYLRTDGIWLASTGKGLLRKDPAGGLRCYGHVLRAAVRQGTAGDGPGVICLTGLLLRSLCERQGRET